jgi:hypothetical protein
MHSKYPTPDHLGCPMRIPDTPEQLFEDLAEPTLRELFPAFDQLEPRNQKLVRLLHTELAKGQLSDGSFQQFVGFTVLLWRSFNAGAMQRNDYRLSTEADVEETWIQAASSFHRMDQFLTSILALLETMPPEDAGTGGLSSEYRLRPQP